jgi:hypothetical protein
VGHEKDWGQATPVLKAMPQKTIIVGKIAPLFKTCFHKNKPARYGT